MPGGAPAQRGLEVLPALRPGLRGPVRPTQPPLWPMVHTRSACGSARRPGPRRHATRPEAGSQRSRSAGGGLWAPGQTGCRRGGRGSTEWGPRGDGALASVTLGPFSGFSATSVLSRGCHCLLEDPCPLSSLYTRRAPEYPPSSHRVTARTRPQGCELHRGSWPGSGQGPGEGRAGSPGRGHWGGEGPRGGAAQGGPSSSTPRLPAVLRRPSRCVVGLEWECRAPDVHVLPLEPVAMTARGGWGRGPAGGTEGLELATLHFLGPCLPRALGRRQEGQAQERRPGT